MVPLWKECSYELKDCLGSTVLPIGSLSVGLCRHRALLFKVCSRCDLLIFSLLFYSQDLLTQEFMDQHLMNGVLLKKTKEKTCFLQIVVFSPLSE